MDTATALIPAAPLDILLHFKDASDLAQAITVFLGCGSVYMVIKVISFTINGVRNMSRLAKSWFAASAVAGGGFFNVGGIPEKIGSVIGIDHLFAIPLHVQQISQLH